MLAEQDVGHLGKHTLLEFMGLGFAEQHFENLNKMHFQKLWDSSSQNETSEISKNVTFVFALNKAHVRRPPPSVVSFELALNKAHVLALNTAQVLRLTKADVLALNKAHVLRLNTKICPVFTSLGGSGLAFPVGTNGFRTI